MKQSYTKSWIARSGFGSLIFDFNNLKLAKDNKPFWEKCKPYFTNKHSKADTDIMLNENGELLLKDKDIADTFNEYLGPLLNH